MSTETKESLEAELAAIVEWEREQKDLWFWEKLGRLPFVLLDRITPKFVHDKVGQAINELGSFIQTGGRYLVSERSMVALLQKEAQRPLEFHQISELPLILMDKAADTRQQPCECRCGSGRYSRVRRHCDISDRYSRAARHLIESFAGAGHLLRVRP